MTTKLVLATFLTFAVSLIMTGLFGRYANYFGLLDRPNMRSSHVKITPRGGGAVFIGVWLVALVLTQKWTASLIGLTISSLIIAAIGFWDDFRSLNPFVRLAVQVTAAVIFCFVCLSSVVDLGSSDIGFTIIVLIAGCLSLVWSANIFNFMDGLNGLAGLQAAFLFGSLGFLQLETAPTMATCNFMLVGALFGFLFWNFPLGKVFMGDVGSGFLGFYLLASVYLSNHPDLSRLIVSMLVLNGIFIIDTGLTLIRRVHARKKWWEAHSEHAYQRLVKQLGWSHSRTVFLVCLFNLVLASLVLLFWRQEIGEGILLVLGSTIALLYYLLAEFLIRQRQLQSQR